MSTKPCGCSQQVRRRTQQTCSGSFSRTFMSIPSGLRSKNVGLMLMCANRSPSIPLRIVGSELTGGSAIVIGQGRIGGRSYIPMSPNTMFWVRMAGNGVGGRKANDPRYTKKKVKHGNGSVMVWGCITRHDVGRLHCINGIMDRFVYTDILSGSLLGTMDDHNLDHSTIYFQHDGDSKHSSKHATGWLDLEGIDVLPWCPNSSDMNILENLWDHLDRMVRARDPLPKNQEELWLALKKEWENIDQGFIDRLYDSLPNRVRELLKAKSRATRY
ncbi:putative homeodomain protein [Mycena venus]|uniref:Putative homeodomain protein n=1 Tax=Mycena venus TaxID=2733690 RepID=A0A8H6ZA98_9AGAR|nr:putative homeodomain protein [Mycena venus]